MNRTLRFILAGGLLALVSIGLVGCATADGLTRFLLAASRGVETSASLDDVATADVADETVDDLAFAIDSELVLLADGEILTNQEKIAGIRALRNQIRLTHATIVLTRESVRLSFVSLREDVAAFRASEETLTAEERDRVLELTDELKTITATLRASIGTCYEKMHALQGRYAIENLDLILSTHQEVYDVLTVRLAQLERIEAIFAELAAMVELPEA